MAFENGRTYALKGDEPLGRGMTRIAAGRAEKALERLRGSASGEVGKADAVHGARRDLKKLRAALRLLRDELPKKVYREEIERYRKAGRALAASRDAEVKLQALERLGEQTEDLPREAIESWRRFLLSDCEMVVSTDEPALAEAVAAIETGLAGIEGWRLEGKGWKVVGGSLTRVYRRGRRAGRDAEADPSEANVHQWRKRVKDLRYALELLERSWSGPLRAAAEESHRLADLLGDHHDLALLREDLRQRRLGEEETGRIEAAIDERQGQLAADALPLGRRLYAERPEDFSRRLRRYWQAWRG